MGSYPARHMWAGHGDLDGLASERRYRSEFIDQPKIDRFAGAVLAGGRRMEDVGVVLRDLFRRMLPWNTGIFCHK